jgi:outer membrane protein
MGIEIARWMGGSLTVCALMAASGAAYALDESDVILRVRAIDVVPNDSSSTVTSAAGTAVPGSEAGVNRVAGVEADLSRMFIASSVGLELITATTSHTVADNGAAGGAFGPAGHVTGVLPPTFTLQYHFRPGAGIRPYLGAGINYTVFYKESSAVDGTALKIDNSVGAAAQAGLDWSINKRWFANLDLKYIDTSNTATLSNAAGAAAYTTDVKIDPWVLGLGVGAMF